MLKSEIQHLQQEIWKLSIKFDDELSVDNVMAIADKSEISSFMNFFL